MALPWTVAALACAPAAVPFDPVPLVKFAGTKAIRALGSDG